MLSLYTESTFMIKLSYLSSQTRKNAFLNASGISSTAESFTESRAAENFLDYKLEVAVLFVSFSTTTLSTDCEGSSIQEGLVCYFRVRRILRERYLPECILHVKNFAGGIMVPRLFSEE